MSEAAISGLSAPAAPGGPMLTPGRFLVALWAAWSLAMIFTTREAVGALDLSDTDNYMRLAEWRDFLAGQDWFDLRQHRFVGPDGGDMHFSRLPDAAMSAFYWLTSPFIGSAAAEQFTLLAFPLLLFLFFLIATAQAAKILAGGRAACAAVVLAMLAPALTQQFSPGRIDHHGLAVVFSMTAFAALLASFERARFAAAAAISAAFAAAVSLETAPVVAAAFSVLTLRWIGSGESRLLRVFGLSMLVAAPSLLFATLGPAALSDVHCDAFAAPAAAALAGAGALAVVFSFLTFQSVLMRGGAAFGGAAATGAALLALFPHCAGGPFEGMDPLVRTVWLSSVGEMKTPMALFRDDPGVLIALYGFPLAALAAGAVSCFSFGADGRSRRLAALLFLASASLLLLAAVRGAAVAAAFAIIPAAVFLADASKPVALRPPKNVARFLALFLLVSPASYGTLGGAAGAGKEENVAAESVPAAACESPASLRALRALSASLLFTPIDLGPAILVQTGHRVTAAPYHRNDLSMRRAIEFFTADEAKARAAFEGSGAKFLIFCPASSEASVFRMIAPGGLAARLSKGAAPDWLSPVEVEGSAPIRVWRRAS